MSTNQDRIFNVLFLCTGNSARSILAECVLNRLGIGSTSVEGTWQEREHAFSMALRYLQNPVRLFMDLPFERFEATALATKLREIGHVEGSTAKRGDTA